MDEELRHLDSDHLDLELQLDAGLLGDRLAHVLDELEHVTRRRGARVHDVVRVLRRHLGAGDCKPLQPALVDQGAAVRGPPGFLKTEPAHGWSNGVPALRHRSRRPCNSFSLAGGSSMSASFASTTITLPRFEDRYLNEICLRATCRIFPLASITVASVSTSANSAPCAPAFMYTPPPTVPGIPTTRSQ